MDTNSKNGLNLHSFCDRITCHGIKLIEISVSKSARIFWSILFTTTVLFLAFQTYVEVHEYVTNPILTSISIEPRDSMPFPSTYICPMSFIDWDYVKYCSNKTEVLERIAIVTPEFRSVFNGAGSNWQDLVRVLPEPHPAGLRSFGYLPIVCPHPKDIANETDEDFIKRNAFSVSMFVRQCKFNAFTTPCSHITTKVIDKEFGVCYVLDVGNVGNMYGGTQATAGLGLSLALDIHSELNLGDPDIDYQPVADGVLVRVQANLDPSSLTGTYVKPGTMTKLSLLAEKRKLISFDGSQTPQQCTESDSYEFKLIRQGVHYSQQLCRTDCVLDLMYRFCGCITPIDGMFIKSKVQTALERFCTRTQFRECALPTSSSGRVMELHECTRKCHVPCKMIEISVASSQTSFPSDGLLRRSYNYQKKPEKVFPIFVPIHVELFFVENGTAITIPPPTTEAIPTSQPYIPHHSGTIQLTEAFRMAKNIIMLDVAFNRLEYSVLEQNPSRTITSLVSSIGGQAGLWTGASIFTFIQLLVYSFQLVTRRRRKVEIE